ncbi:MAG TPA: hypothetical protein VFA05_08835 [Gaiellaceae bacterium]|nr:hypothetical protein [Gaiellaceae bacterium]
MRADRLRWLLIALLALAAAISVVANKSRSVVVGWIGFAVFLGAVALFVAWRRAALDERRRRLGARAAGAPTAADGNAATVARGGTGDDEARTRADR